jgi:hypothetical protein
VTPEVVAKITDAKEVLITPNYMLRERLNNLISMLENQLLSTAALEIRNRQLSIEQDSEMD